MRIDPEKLEATVREVVAAMIQEKPTQGATPPAPEPETALGDGVFPDMDAAITAAHRAQRQYMGCSLADRRRFVEAIREVMLKPENLTYMSEQAVAQSGMGDAAHKCFKNDLTARQTPGVEDLVTEAWSGDDGLTTVEYSPYGVIGAITPTTNPTETITCNTIGMLAAGNSVVFSPHPRVAQLSCWQVQQLNRALRSAGAPDNLVVTVAAPSLENTQAMMSHPRIAMLVATGGPGIVKAVLSSGKKAVGAGAGNPPVVVDESADLDHAAKCIVDGASFDNNLPCIAEKEIIAVDAIADLLKFKMLQHGAHEATGDQIAALERLLIGPEGRPRTEWVGKPAARILEEIGVTPPVGVRLIVCEASASHPFVVNELMMPVIGLVRVPDVDAAIDLAVELEHGNRHTAVMHSLNVSKLTKMGKLIQTTIFVKNGPSYAGIGIGGEGFTTFTIAGPTGEGLTSARTFTRRRRCVLVGDLNIR